MRMSSEVRGEFPAQRVLVGMSGSIAVAVAPAALAWMRFRVGVEKLRVVMTPQAATFMPPTPVSAITDEPTFVGWHDQPSVRIPHVELAAWAQIILVIPATANLLGHVANGLAPNLLTACILAAQCPVVFAPAMNQIMWEKPATQRNVARLRDDGYVIVEPVAGYSTEHETIGGGGIADISLILASAGTVLKHWLNAT